jgi:large subunit ribosomal protein L34
MPPTAHEIGARESQRGSSGQEADPPSSLRCWSPFRVGTAWNYTSPKLTVFDRGANRSATLARAFIELLAGCGNGSVVRRSAPLRRAPSRPGLTRRTLLRTLVQSPESRRYGCDPAHKHRSPRRLPARHQASRGFVGQSCSTGRPTGPENDARCNEERVVAKGKRTFQPNNRRRARVHGFRLRMRTRAGRAIVSGRRRKGRRSLTA